MERPARARVPAIMLSDRAVALMRDVFGQPTLFSGESRIDRRVVAWGKDADPITVAHSAVVVSDRVLLKSLASAIEPDAPVSPDFVIYTSKPLPPGAEEHRFGTRKAIAAEVALKDRGDSSSCWIESLHDGWLFLIPNASESTWLLGVGAPLEDLLASSRVIAPRIDWLRGRSAEFPAAPRIIAPLCGDGWLACGTAAMAFDPICGDGTAQAVREGVLAAAVIRAIADGGDSASLRAHYEGRLTIGMARHLELCAEFYRAGGSGPWWQKELEALTEGQRWCAARLAAAGEPRYQLRDFVLEPRVAATEARGTVYNRGK